MSFSDINLLHKFIKTHKKLYYIINISTELFIVVDIQDKIRQALYFKWLDSNSYKILNYMDARKELPQYFI